ncbi:unnamed protein product [Trypanosoma congolense IL3000]|uniref:WGS project CAEQ00000000 data, annotated contig 1416 n=1 Tax=Trypanosoma congolense (strain IL3000) TaxID=1068625 RepID=F9W625_TRYCI|nr:unnamed protein product [Trypanosoma congolense IL3000]
MSGNNANKKYVYGYELYSKNVVQYSSISDIKTIKSAIAANINDYLTHLEVFESSKCCTIGETVSYSLLAGALFAAGFIYLAKDVLLPYSLTTLSLIGITALATLGAYVCDFVQQTDSVAFSATVSPSAHGNKEYISALKGRRVCIRLNDVPNTSKICMEAQLIGPPSLFGAPEVYFSSLNEVPYGRYFSKDGYFFPPALVNDVDKLLNSLKDGIYKKKQ